MSFWSDLTGSINNVFKIGLANPASIDASGLTAARTQKLPDKAGTFAMMDDVGGGAPPSLIAIAGIVFALYTIDAELVVGDEVDGTDLRYGQDISYLSMLAGFPAPAAFPIVLGTAMSGTWRALQWIPSSTDYFGQGVGGYFLRVT